jgi:hypothetical protein
MFDDAMTWFLDDVPCKGSTAVLRVPTEEIPSE